jgi:hypothetical protein
MLIITLLTKRSSGQRWKLCIMYHIGSVPPLPPFSVCLVAIPSFLPSFPPLSLSLSLSLAFVYYVYVVYVR